MQQPLHTFLYEGDSPPRGLFPARKHILSKNELLSERPYRHAVRATSPASAGEANMPLSQASPVADLSKKQVRKDAADWATGRMGKRPKNTSDSEV